MFAMCFLFFSLLEITATQFVFSVWHVVMFRHSNIQDNWPKTIWLNKENIYLSRQLIHMQNDNKQYWCGWIVVCGMFCIHVHVFEGKADSCVQQPIISWKMTKRWQKTPCLDVNTHNGGDILSWLRGQGTDSEGRNKIDSQPRHIYLYYLQHHKASKFYWWQPRDFILVISMIHSYQMFNALLAQSCCCFFSTE